MSMVGEVILGINPNVDEGVRLGYLSPRGGIEPVLTIGANAGIRSGTVIYAGTTIGAGLETGHNVVIREENKIGDNLNIWNNSVIDYGCVIGNNVKIHCNIYVAQYTILEDDVFMAPGVIIANDMYPGFPGSKERLKGPTIRRGAQIGVNVTILPEVEIGENAMIGSGAVVTKDVPPGVVVYGNPGRVQGRVEDLTP